MASNTKSVFIGAAVGLVVAVGAFALMQASAKKEVVIPVQSQSAAPANPPPQAVRNHFYDVHDGAAYGYTAQLSDVQRQSGQVANNIVMLSYAGMRDGKYQVHLHEGQAVIGYECVAPCEVIKVLTVLDVDGLRNQVRVDHMRSTPNMIAAMALRDAIGGHLEPYLQHYDEQPYELWIDQSKGLTRKRLKTAS
jgi:hypothetical protein